MRIMHVITGLDTGGAEMMLSKLLSATNLYCSHVVVSLAGEGQVGPQILKLGIPIHSLHFRSAGVPNPFRALTIVRLARRICPQIIQGWMLHGNLMASLAGVGLPQRAPVLWNVRMSIDDIALEPGLMAAAIRFGAMISWHPSAIIYNSHTGARQHEDLGYNSGKRVVIPNGFDCRLFCPNDETRRQTRAEFGIRDETVMVGLIGRYHPMKDHAGFLQAAASVVRTHPVTRFLLAGNGVTQQEAKLQRLIADYQLRDHVLLLGERSDMPRLTCALDVACSASAWGEGFSNSVGEAMACGVPCVVTNVGDSAYLVGDTGLAVPARNPEALAQAICQLIEAGPAMRKQLGIAARRRVENEFSLPAIARQYEDLYRECIEGSKVQNTP